MTTDSEPIKSVHIPPTPPPQYCSRDIAVRTATTLPAKRSGVLIPVEAKARLWVPPNLLFNGYGVLCGTKAAGGQR